LRRFGLRSGGNVKKVPFIMQMEALECGAACLAMVLAYYGKWVPLEVVRRDCGVSRDGSNARNIFRAAKEYGLEPRAFRMEPKELGRIDLPAILHWNFNHFVVLDGFKKDQVIINDPANGTRAISFETLDQSFTGIALSFTPTPEFVPEGKPRSVLKFAGKRLAGKTSAIVFVFLVGLFTALVGILTPVFSRVFMDDIIDTHRSSWLMPLLGVMLGALLIQVILSGINYSYRRRMSGQFAITANAEFLWHVLRLPIEFFSQRYVGDVMLRQNSNEGIADTLVTKIAPIVVSLGTMIFYFIMLIEYNPLLTLIGIAAAVLNVVFARWAAKKSMEYSRLGQSTSGRLSSLTMSSISMIETVKAAGAEGGVFERFAGGTAQQQNNSLAAQTASLRINTISQIISQILNILVMLTGVLLIINGHMTIGTLAAFQGFLSSFMAPVQDMTGVVQLFTGMRTDMERVEDVLDYPLEEHFAVDPGDVTADAQIEKVTEYAVAGEGVDQVEVISPEAVPQGKLSGRLSMDHVTFGYDKMSPPLIKDFNLDLLPGKAVAIVGASGSGKSTVAKLITGLYQPWTGDILFDGKPTTQIDEYSFRSSVSMVDQEITLFGDSVADNIRMWDPTIEDFTVILAARDADIHDTIISRPGGYEQVVAENGKNFSGGQRQRLEIARVLAQEPTIAILDEATSALDARTEETVMRNIRKTGCSCVVIAHRLSTIRDCDEIIVLEKGEIVERGTHDELIAASGRYQELIATE